jgi:hypothetical protein
MMKKMLKRKRRPRRCLFHVYSAELFNRLLKWPRERFDIRAFKSKQEFMQNRTVREMGGVKRAAI